MCFFKIKTLILHKITLPGQNHVNENQNSYAMYHRARTNAHGHMQDNIQMTKMNQYRFK